MGPGCNIPDLGCESTGPGYESTGPQIWKYRFPDVINCV